MRRRIRRTQQGSVAKNAQPRLEYGGTLQTRVGGGGRPPHQKLQLRPSFRGVHFKRDLVHSKRVWQ